MEYYIFLQKKKKAIGSNVIKINFDTQEEFNEYIKENIDMNEYNYKILKPHELPKINPLLFASHNIVNDILIPDISIAKEIIKKPIRKRREKLFAPLDAQYMRALEDGDVEKQKEAIEKKKKLRDITNHPLIENAQTLEELSKINIEDLFK